MDEINFTYNFEALNLPKLHREDGITQQEMIQLVERDSFRLRTEGGPKPEETIWVKTEYSLNRRIILVAFICDGDVIFFVGAKVADQDEIDEYYCGR